MLALHVADLGSISSTTFVYPSTPGVIPGTAAYDPKSSKQINRLVAEVNNNSKPGCLGFHFHHLFLVLCTLLVPPFLFLAVCSGTSKQGVSDRVHGQCPLGFSLIESDAAAGSVTVSQRHPQYMSVLPSVKISL